MKPFRGKRIGPQSRLAEFNLLLGGVAVGGILSDPSPFTAAAGWCTFRLVERHDRFAGGHKPPGKVARGLAVSVIAHGWRRPAGGPRNHYPPCRPSGSGALPSRDVRLVRTVHSACRPRRVTVWDRFRAGTQGLWLFGRPPIRPVLKHGPRSLTCARVMGFYET